MWRPIYHVLPASALASLILVSSVSPAAAQGRKGAEALKFALPKAEVSDRDNDELRLLKERFNAALDEWEVLVALVEIGQLTAGDAQFGPCLRRVVDAGRDLHHRAEDRLKLLEEYVRIAKIADDAISGAAAAGRASSQERHRVRYFRLDAELALLREKKGTL